MKNDVVVAVLASGVGLLGALLISIALFWLFKSRRKLARKSRLVPVEMKRRRFSYPEVVNMTNNFRQVIRRGRFATVYHGNLDGAPVAVRLYHENRAAFQTEGSYLDKVYHKNLISLVGYCEEPNKLVLVFEFMVNGDLKKNLAERNLTWERRLGIAIDVAKALDYLHEGCEPPIIHRDIKTSNILLSENFDAKLSDFPLAVGFIPSHDDESDASIDDVAGTVGYMDPQYLTTGKLIILSDVYGFGVVLMEIITGKSVADLIGEEGSGGLLTHWVRSMFANGEVEVIVDPKLEGEFDVYSIEEALKIAISCESENSHDRPTMNQVVVKLKHCLQMESARLNGSISFNPTASIEVV